MMSVALLLQLTNYVFCSLNIFLDHAVLMYLFCKAGDITRLDLLVCFSELPPHFQNQNNILIQR